MHEELTQLLRKDHNVFTRQNVLSRNERHVDGARLIELAPDLSQRFYICGHEGFVRDIIEGLVDPGFSAEELVVEA